MTDVAASLLPFPLSPEEGMFLPFVVESFEVDEEFGMTADIGDLFLVVG